MWSVQQRIEALAALGQLLENPPTALTTAIAQACAANPWFTEMDYQQMLRSISGNYLEVGKLTAFSDAYPNLNQEHTPLTVGIIMAGNIPLVGFHDMLCVLLSGHHSQIKLAEKDHLVWPVILDLWSQIIPEIDKYAYCVERLSDFQAIIATGSNQSARYFQLYFGKYPHLIRYNRNSIAVITGDESLEDLKDLGRDVFAYYGLGCRSVSSLLLPRGYDLQKFFNAWADFEYVIENHKYKHNYDYQLATLIINNLPYHENGFLILQENPQLASKVSLLHYQYYDHGSDPQAYLKEHELQIQAVVSMKPLKGWSQVRFGTAQEPALSDFADRIDTMSFLLSL